MVISTRRDGVTIMTIIIAINEPDADHLAEVMTTMRETGAPSIRAFWTGEVWRAVEGSHRIAAAIELGLEINIIAITEYDEIPTDIESDVFWGRDLVPAYEVLDYLEYDGPRYEI